MKKSLALVFCRHFASLLACLLILGLESVVWASTNEGPKRVLILYSYGRNFSAYSELTSTFQTELAEQSRVPVEFQEVSLREEMFAASELDESTSEYVRGLLGGRQPDLVIPFGGLAVRFAVRMRKELFPSAPLMLAGVDDRHLKNFTLDTNTAVVPAHFDFPVLIDTMRQVLPGTTNVVMVLGNSKMEQFWKQQLEQELAGYTNQLSFTWLNQFSLEEMGQRVSHLPPHSVIFYFSMYVDAAGVPHEFDGAIKMLRAEANAPMIGLFNEELGLGILGGPLLDLPKIGHETALAALRIFNGEPPGNIHVPPSTVGTPIYDWRQLQRWQIPEGRLPAGSVVRYRQLTLWERHKFLIAGGISVLLAQFGLIAGLAVNLRARRKAERSLRESEQRFRMIADSAPVLIWKSDTEKLCVFFNRGWLDFTGRTMQQEVGHGWAEGVHPNDLEGCVKTYNASFDARESFEIEYRLRRHDGEYRWVLDRGVPRYAPGGEFLGYVGVAIDLTDSKRAQEAQQNFMHASRVAVVGEFTAMIVHELNQPLGAMLLNLDAMKKMLDPQLSRNHEVLGILADLRADNVRAGEAVRHIRALVTKRNLKMEPVDLNAAVLDALRLAEPDTRRRRVQLHTDIHAPSAVVWGDVVHLEQLMLNLIVNAMEAMKECPPSERHLFVRTAGGADGYIEVEVRDTGHGIRPEIFARIFESFFTTKPDGMGMGLALVQSIVKMHSGRLWAKNNEDGKGAAFQFILPLLVSEGAKPSARNGRVTKTAA